MATATTVSTPRRLGTAGLLPSLTGLRFVSAIMIFTFHAVYQYPFRDQQLTEVSTKLVTEAGPMAVGFFFILSGFILTWTAKPQLSGRTFWRRRFARIYPNHFVTWSAALVLVLIFGPPLTFASSVPNLFLLHSWVPRGDVMFSMDFVSWSLACEAFFYFSFPMLYRWIVKVRPDRLWAYLGYAFAAVLVIPLLAQLLPAQPLFYDQAVWRIWLVQDFPLTRLLDFVIGMLMARVLLTGRWIGLGLIPAMAVAAAAFVGGQFLPHLYGSAAVGISLVLVIAAAAQADVEGRFTVFRSPTMVRLGELTFAFYLVPLAGAELRPYSSRSRTAVEHADRAAAHPRRPRRSRLADLAATHLRRDPDGAPDLRPLSRCQSDSRPARGAGTHRPRPWLDGGTAQLSQVSIRRWSGLNPWATPQRTA